MPKQNKRILKTEKIESGPEAEREESQKKKQKISEFSLNEIAARFGENASEVKSILKSSTEDDPAIIILWNDNITPFVAGVPNAVNNIPCPFPGLPPAPFSVSDFKDAILRKTRTDSGCSATQFLAILPCTYPQFALAVTTLDRLCFHPWMVAAGGVAPVVPIGTVVTPIPRRSKASNCINPLPPGPYRVGLWG